MVDLVRVERSRLFGAWFLVVAAEQERGTLARTVDRLEVDRDALVRAARDEVAAGAR